MSLILKENSADGLRPHCFFILKIYSRRFLAALEKTREEKTREEKTREEKTRERK